MEQNKLIVEMGMGIEPHNLGNIAAFIFYFFSSDRKKIWAKMGSI